MSTKPTGYVKITFNEKGNLNINTNLAPLGAIHMMANATRVIVERGVEEDNTETEVEKDIN